MPRKKKVQEIHASPDYTGLGRNDKNPQNWLIQKSNPLLSLSETPMTLPEFKILDAYLSRIDSRKPDERYVRFEKGELEKLLGVERISRPMLEQRLKNLFQTLRIYDVRKPKGFTIIALFTKAECEQDDDGLWQVNLACSQEAIEYIFNVENLKYFHYRLKNVINLTSRYSYILYLYLERYRFRKSWDIPLSDLKRLLNCTAETYNVFWRFNDLILKKSHKEIIEKTNVKFSYKPVRKGRGKVTAITFTLETLSDTEKENSEQLTLFDGVQEAPPPDSMEDRLMFFSEACDNSFSIEQVQVFFDILIQIFPAVGDDLKRYDYLYRKYHELLAEEARKKSKGEKPILHRDKYLVALIKKDLG